MGSYIVNGEAVDIRGDRPTAAQLKNETNSVVTDWVMANMPGGRVVKLSDEDPLPAGAEDYSVIAPFTYGIGEA